MSEGLFERLQGDMKDAMKAREKEKLGVLRMLISRIKAAAIDDAEATQDAGVQRMLMTYVKQREEGLAGAEKAGREDLAAQERAEIEIVRSYLPEPLDDAALDALVADVVQAEGATSMKDMGKVIKACLARAEGRADGGRVSAAVKKKLAG